MFELTKADKAWWDRFQGLLDEQTEWPSRYVFKFIVPRAGLDDLKGVFGDHPVIVRASTKGRYISITAHLHMNSSQEVIHIYKAAGQVEGVISL